MGPDAETGCDVSKPPLAVNVTAGPKNTAEATWDSANFTAMVQGLWKANYAWRARGGCPPDHVMPETRACSLDHCLGFQVVESLNLSNPEPLTLSTVLLWLNS